MKPLPINQKHALFHAFLKGTDFKEKKIEKMKEENWRSLISLIFENMGKLIAVAVIKQQHARTMGVGVNLPGLLSPYTKMKRTCAKTKKIMSKQSMKGTRF